MRTPLIKLWNFLKRIFKKTYVRCLERTEVFWIATCSSRWVFATQITAFITYVTTNLKKIGFFFVKTHVKRIFFRENTCKK